jgi:hypothetical protein
MWVVKQLGWFMRKHVIRVAALFLAIACISMGQEIIRQAAVSEFPQLPSVVRRDLQMRGCTVPQPPASRELGNVIRGHFYNARDTDWAVLCELRTRSQSMVLVYRGGSSSRPTELEKQSSEHSCWRQIRPTAKTFIMEHYKAYGGPKPPPIDHQGIDVEICESASTVSYFYQNRWLTLTGSD